MPETHPNRMRTSHRRRASLWRSRESPETFAAMAGIVGLAVVLDLVWSRIRSRRVAAPTARRSTTGD